MVEFWYGVVSVMLTLYVVMDGFDLGAGALHLFVARTNDERRLVLAAIGPYWDGNEVWLLATGGALFVAFPHVLAAGLSGFYFAIFLVLWCLILRGISIEFRSHVQDAMWRSVWDAGLCVASILLAVFFGAALGNLLRGLPIDTRGWFGLALFTDWSAGAPVGIQLMGADVDALAETARRAAEAGAPLVDLNFGCPAKGAIAGCAGSAILREPKALEAIVSACARAAKVPVTAKIRAGYDDDRLLEDLADRLHQVVRLERGTAGQQLVKDRSQ